MKLLVLSDLHLEVAPFEIAHGLDFDVAVLAGDVGAPGDMAVRWMRASRALKGKEVVFVPGNHEYYQSDLQAMRRQMQAAARGSHVHVLDQQALRLKGVRFLGATLWTDYGLPIRDDRGASVDPARAMRAAAFGLADYSCIHTGARAGAGAAQQGPDGGTRALRPQDTARIHAEQRDWLAAQLARPFEGPTVVVTHHAPHPGSVAPQYASEWLSAAFAVALPQTFFQVPVLWVHGHTHHCFDYVVHNTRIVCNPRGYVRSNRQGRQPQGRQSNRRETIGFALDRIIEV